MLLLHLHHLFQAVVLVGESPARIIFLLHVADLLVQLLFLLVEHQSGPLDIGVGKIRSFR